MAFLILFVIVQSFEGEELLKTKQNPYKGTLSTLKQSWVRENHFYFVRLMINTDDIILEKMIYYPGN